MKNVELVVEALMVLPFILAGILVLWIGLGFCVYRLYKWLFDRG